LGGRAEVGHLLAYTTMLLHTTTVYPTTPGNRWQKKTTTRGDNYKACEVRRA